MPPSSARDRPEVFLVQAREAGLLGQVLGVIESDSSITLLRRIGPFHEPHTLVVSMTGSQAAALKQRFQGKLMVERDRPLTLYEACHGTKIRRRS